MTALDTDTKQTQRQWLRRVTKAAADVRKLEAQLRDAVAARDEVIRDAYGPAREGKLSRSQLEDASELSKSRMTSILAESEWVARRDRLRRERQSQGQVAERFDMIRDGDAVKRAYAEGASVRDLGRSYGVSRTTIWDYLRSEGVQMRGPGGSKPR